MTTLMNRFGNVCILCIGAVLAAITLITTLVMIWLSII